MKFVPDVLDELLYLTSAACALRAGGIHHVLSLKRALARQRCPGPTPWVGGPHGELWETARLARARLPAGWQNREGSLAKGCVRPGAPHQGLLTPAQGKECGGWSSLTQHPSARAAAGTG